VTKKLTKARFDLFAIGTRLSSTYLVAEELSYWSDLDETVIGVVFRDTVDDDFGWALLVRDRIGRFRAIDLNVDVLSRRRAEAELRLKISEVARTADLSEYGIQGDETNAATDLLTPLGKGDALHPYFELLLSQTGRAPARAVLSAIGPWLTVADPHFVQEFQRHQFDQRLWELYLWAAFREGGFDVERLESMDFLCSSPWARFCVEATTVGPSLSGVLATHPDPQSEDEMEEFLRGYMAIKFASGLTGKLSRRSAKGLAYWEEEQAVGLPFVIAIADFHKPATEFELASMTYSGSAIAPYLYGVQFNSDGSSTSISEHSYNGKTIPSGFFFLPTAENVSAVLFSNAGTIAKFDRMGVQAGFAPIGHHYVRNGVLMRLENDDLVREGFSRHIGIDGSIEGWADELQIYHNPNAKHPIGPEAFLGITQHFWENGTLKTLLQRELILSSTTTIIGRMTDE
jgi:hypothetical protein